MIEFFTQYSDEDNLCIHYCGYEKCEPDHFWGPAIREHAFVTYIISGKGIYETNGSTFNLSKHTSYFVLPEQISFYKADHEEPWEYIWLGFSGTSVKHYLELINVLPDQPILYHKNHETIETLFFQIFNCMQERNTACDIYCLGLFRILIAELIRDSAVIPDTSNNVKESDQSIVNKAINFININYSKDISVQSIADFVGFERSYFTKIFKQKINMTPHEYLLKTRIERASRLLCYTNTPIEQVAYSVGFDDPLYFSKVFKKYRSNSPSVYRTKNASNS